MNEIKYVIAALVVAAIVFTIFYMEQGITTHEDTVHTLLFIQVAGRVVQCDNKKLIKEMAKLSKDLSSVAPSVYNNNRHPKLISQIESVADDCLRSLNYFVKHNPGIKGGPVDAKRHETRAEIIHRNLEESINYNPFIWHVSYKSILESDTDELRQESGVAAKYQLVIQHVNIVIEMLDAGLCDKGKINMDILYALLNLVKQHINLTQHDPTYNATIDLHMPNSAPPPKQQDFSEKKNMYKVEQRVLEPFEGRETPLRGDPMYYNKKAGSTARHESSVSNAPDVITTYKNTDGSFELPIMEQIADIKPKKCESLEGLVEMDILRSARPGHLISKLYDRRDHYDNRPDVCLGRTLPDEVLLQ
jgi:hypothetical protein